MKMSTKRRDGFALAVAILAIVVIGALIAGAFFASTQEYQVGRNTLVQTRAFGNAEEGLNDVYSQWDNSNNLNMATGASLAFNTPTANVTVTRTSPKTFWAVSKGVAGLNSPMQANRRTGMVWKLEFPQMQILAALTSRGSTRVGGSSQINGFDTPVAGWTCPAPVAPLPGIVVERLGDIRYSGGAVQVIGDPPTEADPRVADTATFFNFGESNWAQLAAGADIRIPGGTNFAAPAPSYTGTPSRCNTSVSTNWGDVSRNIPEGKCEDYFPIIYAAGDLSLQGGRGQGILLVEGDLRVTGGFEFYGPVIVRGSLATAGTGGHFNGGVMAANVDLETNSVLGNAVITFSNCAIQAALNGSTSPTIVSQRAWADMF